CGATGCAAYWGTHLCQVDWPFRHAICTLILGNPAFPHPSGRNDGGTPWVTTRTTPGVPLLTHDPAGGSRRLRRQRCRTSRLSQTESPPTDQHRRSPACWLAGGRQGGKIVARERVAQSSYWTKGQ